MFGFGTATIKSKITTKNGFCSVVRHLILPNTSAMYSNEFGNIASIEIAR